MKSNTQDKILMMKENCLCILDKNNADMAKKRATEFSMKNNFVNQFTSLTLTLSDSSQNYKLEAGGRADITYSLVKKSRPPLDIVTETIEDPNACNITLYSKVWHSGDRLTLRDSVPDLQPWEFEDKLESLRVEGPCSWTIFNGELSDSD